MNTAHLHGTLPLVPSLTQGKREPLTGDTSHVAGLSPLPAAPLLLPRLTPLSAHSCQIPQRQHALCLSGLCTSSPGLVLSGMFTPSFLPLLLKNALILQAFPDTFYVKQRTSLPAWALFIFVRAIVTT